MTTREIPMAGGAFYDEFHYWAGDFADDFDWPRIQDEFNRRLSDMAPEPILSWGWFDKPYIEADIELDPEEARAMFSQAVECIHFEGFPFDYQEV